MITIQNDRIEFIRARRLTPDYSLPLLRLERCPFCQEEILRAWFGLPKGVEEISPARYEGLPEDQSYKSAFQVVGTPGYEGLIRRKGALHWYDTNQAVCPGLAVFCSLSRPANLEGVMSHLRYSFLRGEEERQIGPLLDRLSDDQWDVLAQDVLPRYLDVPFTWGEIRAPVEELSGQLSSALVFKEPERAEPQRWGEWRDQNAPQVARFLREFLAPALQPARGDRYAQIRPWD